MAGWKGEDHKYTKKVEEVGMCKVLLILFYELYSRLKVRVSLLVIASFHHATL